MMNELENIYYRVHVVWDNGNVDNRIGDTLAEAKQEIQEVFSMFGKRIAHCHIFECKRIDTIPFMETGSM